MKQVRNKIGFPCSRKVESKKQLEGEASLKHWNQILLYLVYDTKANSMVPLTKYHSILTIGKIQNWWCFPCLEESLRVAPQLQELKCVNRKLSLLPANMPSRFLAGTLSNDNMARHSRPIHRVEVTLRGDS